MIRIPLLGFVLCLVCPGLVLGQGMAAVGAGALVGVLAAFGLARLLTSLLYGLSASDPVAFVAAPLLLLLVAFGATWLPARRAAHVDPMVALRAD